MRIPDATRALGVAVLAVVIVNGLEPFLLRVGVVERPAYENAWAELCGDADVSRAPWGIGARCAPSLDGRLLPVLWPENRARATAFTLGMSGLGRAAKVAKDALVLAVLACVCVASFRGGPKAPLRGRWALLGLGGLIVGHAVLAASRGELLPIVASLRSFEVLPLALLLPPLAASNLAVGLGPWVTRSIAAQVPFLALELVRSLPVQKVSPFLHMPQRLSGTLVMPNTLGTFAAVGLAYVLAFEPDLRRRLLTTGLSIACVAASGSGTGWLVLALVAAWQILERRRRVAGWFLAAAFLASALWLLPRLSGRPDIYDSLGGRVAAMKEASRGTARELLLGGAIGAGSTTLTTLDPALAYGPSGRRWWAGDSAVTALLAQTGLVGLVFAGVAWAASFRRDRPARPFLVAVALASFTLPVLDLFPVNLLFALVLGRAPRGPSTALMGET